MAQQYKEKSTTKTAEPEKQDAQPANQQDAQLTDDVDDLLAEIDDVLEVNAEEFVRGYVQQGGE